MDMSKLSFPEGSFDHVISSFAIYGSFPPGIGLREAHRVLKNGGKLAFSMLGKPLEGSGFHDVALKIYGRHLTGQPSELLKKLRQAMQIGVVFGFFSYGALSEPSEPSSVLRIMRGLGFKKC